MSTDLQQELKEITLHARQLLIANGNSEKNLHIATTALTKILETACLKDAIQIAKGALLQVDNANYLAAYGAAQLKANPRLIKKEEKQPAPKKNPGWDNVTSTIKIEKPEEKKRRGRPPSIKPIISASVEPPKKPEMKKKNGQKWIRGTDGKVRRTDGSLF
jgi:hypothetical protein